MFRRDMATGDQFLDETVVARHTPHTPVAEQVQATVAGPQADDVFGGDEQYDHRAADDRSRLASRRFAEGPVGGEQAGADVVQQCRGARRRRYGFQRLDQGTAGEVAAFVTAHPVGDEPEPDVVPGEKSILVDGTYRPTVGGAGRPVGGKGRRHRGGPEEEPDGTGSLQHDRKGTRLNSSQ